jgi:hypothetical protein
MNAIVIPGQIALTGCLNKDVSSRSINLDFVSGHDRMEEVASVNPPILPRRFDLILFLAHASDAQTMERVWHRRRYAV